MTRSTENEPRPLTPQKAADVIHYYHDNENRGPRERGWKDKTSLGQSAVHATLIRHSLLPANEGMRLPTLTKGEMGAGLAHIEHIEDRSLPTRSEEYYAELDELVDKRNLGYDEARRILEQRNKLSHALRI